MRLPPIGFGCSPVHPGGAPRSLAPIITEAVELGYPLLDTAELYGTERLIGDVFAREPDRRQEIFLVSKLWSTHHRPHLVRAACERSLRALRTDYLDLYLIHSPKPWRLKRDPADNLLGNLLDTATMQAHARGSGGERTFTVDDVPIGDTWHELESLEKEGLVRAIGVSNFEEVDLRALLATGARPVVNQIACDPLNPRNGLTAFCRQHQIAIMAHSPFAAPGLLEHPSVLAAARRCSRSPAQIVLRWNIERGALPLPSTTRSAHLAENLAAADANWPTERLVELDHLSW